MASGVPHGSVLGPLLFLVYINDLPACVTSEARLFADDCILYRTVNTQEDVSAIQDDIDRLQEWEEKWLMKFNPEKCEVLRVTNKTRHILTAQYTIHGTTLQTVDEAKHLGVTIHGKINWKTHVNNICKKANITQGFLGRNLRNCTPKVNEQVYRTYVLKTNPRICLNPSTDLLATQIDMVQRRAARFVQSDYRRRHSVTAMLQQLNWQTIL